MSAIDDIRAAGQQVWLDDISRAILDEGSLADYRDRCGVGGVTANPTIYETAIRTTEGYSESIARHVAAGEHDPERIFWALAIDDIQRTADLLRERFGETGGTDGLVSLELSPTLAFDTDGSIDAAVRLFDQLDRPNVMVKVPGTPPGVPAIEELIARGVNVNVTLLFGVSQWEAVWEAYERGLERRVDAGEAPTVTSVASFFLSRIDDKLSDRLPADLANRAAIASAAQAYAEWLRRRAGDRWQRLEKAGGRPQQLLWASLSTKDPALPETYYVERLIAPESVDTMPLRTLDALCELDAVGETRLDEVDHRSVLNELDAIEQHGVRLDDLAVELQNEGVEKFDASFQSLLAAIADEVKQHA